jgi:hypothetical protein
MQTVAGRVYDFKRDLLGILEPIELLEGLPGGMGDGKQGL